MNVFFPASLNFQYDRAKPGDNLWAGKVSPYQNSPDWEAAIAGSLDGVRQLVNEWLQQGKCAQGVKATVVGTDSKPVSQTFVAPIRTFQWPGKAKK